MTDRSYRWMFWLLAFLGLAVDQGSKYYLFDHFYNDGRGGEMELIPGCFKISVKYDSVREDSEGILRMLRCPFRDYEWRPHVNKGALFGIGQGQNLIFGIVSVLAAVFIIGWSFRESSRRDGFLCFALGLILAGTLGNLYDRVVFEGVRDFLYWYRWYDWPVFNIADVCLVCGAGMLLLEAFFRKTEPDAMPANRSASAETAPLKDAVHVP